MALNLGSLKAAFPGLSLPRAAFPLGEALWGWSSRWANPRAPHLPALPKDAEQAPWQPCSRSLGRGENCPAHTHFAMAGGENWPPGSGLPSS